MVLCGIYWCHPRLETLLFSASVDGGLCPLAGQKSQELWQSKVNAGVGGDESGLLGRGRVWGVGFRDNSH